jgi:hypothetical protein
MISSNTSAPHRLGSEERHAQGPADTKNPQGQAVQVSRIRFSQYFLSALQAGKAIKSARASIVTNVKHAVGENC